MGINQRRAASREGRCRSAVPPVSTRGRLRRHLLGVAVVFGLLGGVLSTAQVASAEETNRFHRSSSAEVADAAVQAIAAFEMWEQSGRVTVYLEYLEQLGRVAHLAAWELALDGDEMQRAWNNIEPPKQLALLSALTQLGVPYQSMASIPGEGFDCSGLVMFAWSQAGVALPRSSGDQIRAGAPLSRDEAGAGDFAYYPGHMMMYLGIDDAVVHSPNSGNLVEIRFVSRSLQYGDPLGA